MGWPITQPYMSFANKIAPGVSERFPSREVFEKIGVKTPKKSVFSHFWKIVELNADVLEI